jgi:hypothetical protein
MLINLVRVELKGIPHFVMATSIFSALHAIKSNQND